MGSIDNLMLTSAARYETAPVSEDEYYGEVEKARASITADDLLDQLQDCKHFLDIALKCNDMTLFAGVVSAVRDAYAVRLADFSVNGYSKSPSSEEAAAQFIGNKL